MRFEVVQTNEGGMLLQLEQKTKNHSLHSFNNQNSIYSDE